MSRLRYPCYRCYSCGKLITSLQIEKIWKKAETAGSASFGLCSCGSRKVTPTNPTLREEFTFPVIKLWFVGYVLPWLKRKLGLDASSSIQA